MRAMRIILSVCSSTCAEPHDRFGHHGTILRRMHDARRENIKEHRVLPSGNIIAFARAL